MNLTPSEIQAIAAEIVELLKPLFCVHQQTELTSSEVATLLSVSKPTVERWTRDKIIPSYLVGRCRRYNRESVLHAIQEVNEHEPHDDAARVAATSQAASQSTNRELQSRGGT